MGASNFRAYGKGKTAAEAFAAARRQGINDANGATDYTGTIASKDSFTLVSETFRYGSAALRKYEAAMLDTIDSNEDLYGLGTTHGPAIAVQLKKGQYFFFGMAPE
jgi:hypothetical protein